MTTEAMQPFPVAASGGPTMTHFGGRRRSTDLSLALDATGVAYHPDLPDLDVSAFAGDGTVAPFSCLPAGHDSTDKATYWPVRHSGLQSDPRVLDHLVDAVNGIDLGAALGPEPELSLTLPEVVRRACPAPSTSPPMSKTCRCGCTSKTRTAGH